MNLFKYIYHAMQLRDQLDD